MGIGSVLLSDDGCDGSGGIAGGSGDGNARGHVSLTIELITPIAMEKELRFAIREGGRYRRRRRHQ